MKCFGKYGFPYILWFCIIFISLMTISDATEADKLVVNVISVGHGDAIFIEFPNHQCMLVDGGLPSEGDTVVDYIKRLGYTSINFMVMTHTHRDHIGGLITVLDSFQVGEVWMSDCNEESPLFDDFKSKIEKAKLPIKKVCRGDTITIGNVTAVILNPPMGSTLEQLGSCNNTSIVIRLEYGTTSFLLAADIENKIDRELAQLYGNRLKSTVLKCAHHGSEISSSQEFLSAVSPQIAIISSGADEYGYPSEATIARIKSMIPKLYRTDLDGTVVVTSDGKNVTVTTR
jgi:competence protein ComEC